MSDRITITPLKDGPDQVSGPVTVLETKPAMLSKRQTLFSFAAAGTVLTSPSATEHTSAKAGPASSYVFSNLE